MRDFVTLSPKLMASEHSSPQGTETMQKRKLESELEGMDDSKETTLSRQNKIEAQMKSQILLHHAQGLHRLMIDEAPVLKSRK